MHTLNNDTVTAAAPQFRTICRIGYWLHVDAMWTTKRDQFGLTSNYVYFNLVDGYGNPGQIGFSIITTDDTGFVPTDEDGDQFPDLETAIRCHAERLLKLEWQWTDWQDRPPVHRSCRDGKATEVAFVPRDIAWAVELAAKDAAPIVISGARRAGSSDWTGDHITAEEDAVVSRVLERQPELANRHSRCQIYRMVQRGEIAAA
jgi:hypothetical protein